jgi:tRNA pseudouridine38-40 synthase
MHSAAQILVRPRASRDLSVFRKARSAASHTNIHVLGADVYMRHPYIVELEVKADWFVYGMMRLLAAALVEVGRGAWSLSDFDRAVETGDRSAVRHSAPAAGLCLLEVGYETGVCPLGRWTDEEQMSGHHRILDHAHISAHELHARFRSYS